MKYSLILILSFTCLSISAQNSIRSQSYPELEAFEDFQAKKYQNVISNLKRKTSLSADEEILLTLSELRAGKDREDDVLKWLEQNPKHPLRPLAHFHIGEYYFYRSDSTESKKYLSKINAGELTRQDRGSYGFMYGVLQLNTENYQNAKDLFQFSLQNDFSDKRRLNYYLAFSDYHLENYSEALAGFEKAKESEAYETSSKFFIAKIQLESGNYQEVIALAQNELSEERSITNSGFHQLIGEAYAIQDQTAKADAYFEQAINIHPKEPTAALYYQAGVAKFKIGNEDRAIEYLTKSGLKGGEYARLSAFQLGRLYLKKMDYERSLSSYIEASASSDKIIKEEALFHAATINAQLGFYTEAINYSNDYLKQFKNESRAEEIQNLIAQSYLRTSNYDLAIEQLRSLGFTNDTQKEVYQKVTYQKAIQKFNDANFDEARSWFSESLKFTPDPDLTNQAYFHLGEIAMRTENYDQAIGYYKNQSSLNALTQYGLGYSYYNRGDYKTAIIHFKQVKGADQRIVTDANVRLADCLYAIKDYNAALSVYNNLLSGNRSQYLTFQKSMTLKALGQNDEAIQSFDKLTSSPKFAPEAAYQSGMIRFESAQFAAAESYFTRVIQQFSQSDRKVNALLNRAISRKNQNKLDEAKEDYEIILKNHIKDKDAINAILGMQELQQAGLKIGNLDKYIAEYKEANPEDGSLEVVEFETAKRMYFDFKYDQAIPAFEKFVRNYPNSGDLLEAKYYIGDSYYRLERMEEAKPVFDELKFVRNIYTGRILSRLGDINTRLEKYNEAVEAYNLLKDLELSAKDTYNARQGLMYIHYEAEEYVKAIALANEIIQAEWKPINGEQEALIIIARSHNSLNNTDQAINYYERLSKGEDAFAVESNYQLALFKFEAGDHEKSNDMLFELNAKFGSYAEWIDKSYLLIARNYIGMDELFQAKATLRSIIQHAKDEEIKSKAQEYLNQIEQGEINSDSLNMEDQ